MSNYSTIEEYKTALLNGATTSVATVQYFLDRISSSTHLNAFIEVFKEEALHRAEALDELLKSGKSPGKLHGVVIAIKDVICYSGHKVTAASAILKDFTATYNATAVQKLLQEGAIIIGNLNCDEFAMGSTNENSIYGNVLNAEDNSRVPGGSSGGSAVAVQAGLCMAALGSDTGGSVRQPADFCGIVGLKPTYGRVSRYGLIAYASSFDQIGILGNNIPDVAAILEVISGPDDFDATCSDEPVPAYASLIQKEAPFKLCFIKEALEHPGLDPEMATAYRDYIESLKHQGWQVQEIDFEYLEYIVPAYYILTTAEASSNLSRFDGVRYGHRPVLAGHTELTDFYMESRSSGFGWEVKRRIMLGTFVLSTGYYDAYFTQAQKVRKMLVDRTALIFKDFDAILLPTVPSTAFKLGEKTKDPIAMYLADIYTVFGNLTGIPGISIPLFRHSNGLPFGLQIMSNRFSEVSLLRLSHQMMNNRVTIP